jgi:hypothetical protein
MRSPLFPAAIVFLIGVVSTAHAALKVDTPPDIMTTINVTSDSSAGWTPEVGQRQLAIQVVQTFLNALDSGRDVEAYDMQTEAMKHYQTAAQFSHDAQKFRTTAGPAKAWRILKVTWTKDPAQAPFPGVYAAVDITGEFANVDRNCGYIVLYQASANDAFSIMRRENNYMENATAQKIAKEQSADAVERIWGHLSQHCPNYSSRK